ncbi:MAG: MGMT family protein [Candidatus ainarchaeum sp.]|nr:MGMT family protein [Candidatus ainarchaeum sp.]
MATRSFTEKVYSACARIPKGKVSTYSRIARAIKKPKSARAVGNALNKNRSKSVPCHRVIRSDGDVGGFAHGTRKKIAMLRREGVEIKNGKAPKRFLFTF